MDVYEHLKNKEQVIIEIWGTAVKTSFSDEQDLYPLLDRLFWKKTKSNLLFHKIRKEMDFYANLGTLSEKYQHIKEKFDIPDSDIEEIRTFEEKLRIKLSLPRKYVKEIYEYALHNNITVVFYSDTGSDIGIQEEILHRNGYFTFEKLITSKEDLEIHIEEALTDKKGFLYIGSDSFLMEYGIETLFIPDTMDVFWGKFYSEVQCGKAVYDAVKTDIDCDKMLCSPGIGIMLRMVSNHFFDNPFVEWKSESIANGDLYFAGYYTLGMHLAGILKWLKGLIVQNKYEHIYFCARDGYLIKKAYDRFRKVIPDLPESTYLYASRKVLLPSLLSKKSDFYQLPGPFLHDYSPEVMLKYLWAFNRFAPLYDFNAVHFSEKSLLCKTIVEKEGFDYEKKFENYEEYLDFIQLFFRVFYDREKHLCMKQNLGKYYKTITGNDAIFDLGYSGKLPAEIHKLSGATFDILYLYTDEEFNEFFSRIYGLHIYTFYQHTPYLDNMLREYIVSESTSSCSGLKEEKGKIVPVFENEGSMIANHAVLKLQKGALDFVQDLLCRFGDLLEDIPFKSQEASIPFEQFMRAMPESDLQGFSGAYQEDYITGLPASESWSEVYRRSAMRVFKDTVI